MSDFPSSIRVRLHFPKVGEEILTCKKLLRTVPGSRDVFEAAWKDADVIAKVFSHRISAKRHLKREWHGLKILQKHRISAPEPIFCGKTEDGKWVVAETKVHGSLTALDAYNQAVEKADKLDILIRVCQEIARQHENGVFFHRL